MQKQSKTIQWKWLYHIQSCKKCLNDPMKIVVHVLRQN